MFSARGQANMELATYIEKNIFEIISGEDVRFAEVDKNSIKGLSRLLRRNADADFEQMRNFQLYEQYVEIGEVHLLMTGWDCDTSKSFNSVYRFDDAIEAISFAANWVQSGDGPGNWCVINPEDAAQFCE